jgi:hypothetical protein
LNEMGIVVIGRNEGERLRRCLESIVGRAGMIVYVDSGSFDGSIALARSFGAEVVELDLSLPFTAARARNIGGDRVCEILPGARFIQFIDGDCELAPEWLPSGLVAMASLTDAAVICGRRREIRPEASIYNRLADVEWNTPIGEAVACGGDAMMRIDAFREVGGYDPTLIAGEEPELCWRFRHAGWRVFRIDAEMTRHDIDMTRFGQWWRRQVRYGYAIAHVTEKHPEGPYKRQARRAWCWTVLWSFVLVTTAGIAGACGSPIWALGCAIVACAPLAQMARIAVWIRPRASSRSDSIVFGSLLMISKWAEALGQLRRFGDRITGRGAVLIEYKSRTTAGRFSHHDQCGLIPMRAHDCEA